MQTINRHAKLLLAALTTTTLLALAVGSASANRLSVSNRNFRTTWTSLQLRNNITTEVILCEVTLESSFHENIVTKVEQTLIGYVTRATLRNPCTGGSATIHQETLPWHIRYNGFTGTLPNITGVKLLLVGLTFDIRLSGTSLLTCTGRSEVEHPAVGSVNLNSGVATSLTPEANARIPLSGAFCSGTATYEGPSSTLTVLGATTRITVTLI